MNYRQSEGWSIPGYDAKVILDSVAPSGKRLISVQATYPLIVHGEVMTSRVFSRNSASSRAIPVKTFIKSVENNPFIPDKWYYAQKGMQPGEQMTSYDTQEHIDSWLRARDAALTEVKFMESRGCAKEIANRLLGPYFWNTILITSTEWANFFNLRCHPMAQRQMRIISEMIRDVIFESAPTLLEIGDWHLPYIDDQACRLAEAKLLSERGSYAFDPDMWSILKKVSTGRCGRLSYVNQEGRVDIDGDIILHDRLVERFDSTDPIHGSPAEHIATPQYGRLAQSGNFNGYEQYRKTIVGENRNSYEWNGIIFED